MSGIPLEELPKTIRKRTQASSAAMTVALAATGSLGIGDNLFLFQIYREKSKNF